MMFFDAERRFFCQFRWYIWSFFQKHVGVIYFQYFCCFIKFTFNKRDGIYSWGFGLSCNMSGTLSKQLVPTLSAEFGSCCFSVAIFFQKSILWFETVFKHFMPFSRRLKVDSIGETVRMWSASELSDSQKMYLVSNTQTYGFVDIETAFNLPHKCWNIIPNRSGIFIWP